MIPTPKLRFVERDSYSHNGEHFATPHKVRILQQWWEQERMAVNMGRGEMLIGKIKGEWHDVPLEKEA